MAVDIKHIAKLANLRLFPDEEKTLESQLEETISYVNKLSEINTDGIQPTSQVTGLENVERDDVAGPSLSQEQALQNAKSKYNGFFKVEQILED